MLPYVLPSTHLRTSWNTRSAGFNSGLYGGWMMVASPTLRTEIYLHDATLYADDVWPHILEQGREFDLRVIAPSHIRRLEAGILSYGQDIDIENNPYEVRLGWQVDLGKSSFIGKDALVKIASEGVKQRLVGLRVGGEPIVWYNEGFYPVRDVDTSADVGYVTSAFWSTSPYGRYHTLRDVARQPFDAPRSLDSRSVMRRSVEIHCASCFSQL